MSDTANWFTSGGEDYARYRPVYPASLAQYLASVAPSTQCALDVGCGTGQLTRLLAEHFQHVTGLDPSQTQIDHAAPHDRIDYRISTAEELPADIENVDLVTVAQAAHWFDLNAFYQQAGRVAAPGAVIALISYGVPEMDDAIGERFRQFYYDEIGPFWPPERKWVDNGYRDLFFPFEDMAAPAMAIRLHWPQEALLGYISTWSAVKRARDAGQEALLMRFQHDLRQRWGNVSERAIVWPVNIRAGRL